MKYAIHQRESEVIVGVSYADSSGAALVKWISRFGFGRDRFVARLVGPGEGEPRTPYAVQCRFHGRVYLGPGEYSAHFENERWRCHCGKVAAFDKEHFDGFYEEEGNPPDG